MDQQLSSLAVFVDKRAKFPVLKGTCNYPLFNFIGSEDSCNYHEEHAHMWYIPLYIDTTSYSLKAFETKKILEAGRKSATSSAMIQNTEVLMSWILFSWEKE